jgi:hypothetical protein
MPVFVGFVMDKVAMGLFSLILLFIPIITVPGMLHHDRQFLIPIMRRDWIGWLCMLLPV